MNKTVKKIIFYTIVCLIASLVIIGGGFIVAKINENFTIPYLIGILSVFLLLAISYLISLLIKEKVNNPKKEPKKIEPDLSTTVSKPIPYAHLTPKGSPKHTGYPINRDKITLGREIKNDIAIKDDTVSRYHAHILKLEDETFIIKDLDSTNGTSINGIRIKEQKLNDGDIIAMGDVLFVFHSSFINEIKKTKTT